MPTDRRSNCGVMPVFQALLQRDGRGGPGRGKTVDLAMEVADLLSKALEIATAENSVGWVVAWLDAREDLGDFGHTQELKEQIEGLEAEKADLLCVYPRGSPWTSPSWSNCQVEEFFRHLRDPAHRPAAGDRLEALLQRCRGFKVEQLRWDNH